MAMTDELAMKCFQIITQVGTARSYYINAIQCAKEGKFDEAAQMIKDGEEAFNQGHNEHADLLTLEANGEIDGSGVLLIHAEDMLMSSESFRIIAEEFIEVYKRMQS